MTFLDNLTGDVDHRVARADADKAVLSTMVREGSGGGRFAPPIPGRLGLLSVKALVAGVLAVGVLAGGGVAAAVVLLTPQRPTVLGGVRCYTELSTNFTASFPGTTVIEAQLIGTTGNPDVADRAIATCAQFWAEWMLVYGQSKIDTANVNGPQVYPVPQLAVCVVPSGMAAVFPGGADTCSKLGLPPLAPPPSSSGGAAHKH